MRNEAWSIEPCPRDRYATHYLMERERQKGQQVSSKSYYRIADGCSGAHMLPTEIHDVPMMSTHTHHHLPFDTERVWSGKSKTGQDGRKPAMQRNLIINCIANYGRRGKKCTIKSHSHAHQDKREEDGRTKKIFAHSIHKSDTLARAQSVDRNAHNDIQFK